MSTDTKDMELAETLWKEYEPNLRKICSYKLSGYPSEIDDVIGDTYLALCNAVDKGVEIENPKAWLYGILNNMIKMKYTEINRKKKYCIRLENVENSLFYDIDFDAYELSDEILEDVKDNIFDELLESDKTLLTLIYDKKLKFKEISKILDISEVAVKQRHYRLKRKIKKIAKIELNKFE